MVVSCQSLKLNGVSEVCMPKTVCRAFVVRGGGWGGPEGAVGEEVAVVERR
jgi:hypothetical protein